MTSPARQPDPAAAGRGGAGAARGRELVLDGPGRLRIAAHVERPLARREVRLRTHSAGICGSDVHGFTGANRRRAPGTVMGHEAAATVVERGGEVRDVAIGQRVAVNPAVTCGACEFCRAGQDHRCPHRRLHGCVPDLPGAFADFLVVDAGNAVPFDGPAPLEWGALVEPFAVGEHAVGLLQGGTRRGVVVLGGGPIGIGCALAARRRGIERVVLVERGPHRRRIAAALGLEAVDPAEADALDRFDAAVECVGSAAATETAMRLTGPGAEVAFVGLGDPAIPLPVERLVVAEKVVRGSFNYSRAEFAEVATWVGSGAVDLSCVIEAHVGFDGLEAAFHDYAAGSTKAMKTVLQPHAL